MVYPNVTYLGPAHRPSQAKISAMRRELDSRTGDGIHVRLLWQPDDGRVLVAVNDTKTGEAFELPVPDGEQALDVFRQSLRIRRRKPVGATDPAASVRGVSATAQTASWGRWEAYMLGIDEHPKAERPLIEVRTYRARPGQRERQIALMASSRFGFNALGMRVLGPFPSLDHEETFVWLRAFPPGADRDALKRAFYEGPEWTRQLEQQLMPLVEDYASVLVEDDEDLWQLWPSETR